MTSQSRNVYTNQCFDASRTICQRQTIKNEERKKGYDQNRVDIYFVGRPTDIVVWLRDCCSLKTGADIHL